MCNKKLLKYYLLLKMKRATRKRNTPPTPDFSDDEQAPVVPVLQQPSLIPPPLPRYSPLPPPTIVSTIQPDITGFIKPITVRS